MLLFTVIVGVDADHEGMVHMRLGPKQTSLLRCAKTEYIYMIVSLAESRLKIDPSCSAYAISIMSSSSISSICAHDL